MIGRERFLAALAIGLVPLTMVPTVSQAQISIGISVRIGPPPLPVYFQPAIPAPNYIWAPGYWAWDDWWGDYYWVPGTWVQAPRPGLLWTPGWWGWNDGAYAWHGGYWGRHVGWYGGIPYGFGYTGTGYFGGEWRGGDFYYNRAVTNVGNGRVTNVFNRTVVNNVTIINNHRISYSGGPGGIAARPTPEQRMAMTEPHIAATPQQMAHTHAAQADRSAFASVNHGRPAVLAQAHPRPAPAGPIHPPGMARPAPGGGLPGGHAQAMPRPAPGGGETTGMQRPAAHPEKPDEAGPRPERSGGMDGAARERGQAAPAESGMEHPAHPPRPMAGETRTEDRAPPMEHAHVDRAPPAERPHVTEAPPPPHPPAPPHHASPPPEHHEPPHEGGGEHGQEGDHHHD